MILRLEKRPAAHAQPASSAWEVFSATQERSLSFTGCISQPSHAALAGRIAGALRVSAFGDIPAEVIDVIGRHDVGWAQADLAALESSDRTSLVSFLLFPVSGSIDAWQHSIRAAEKRSLLAGILTSRHFCLLASPDDPLHIRFRQEEAKQREPKERACTIPSTDLDRYLAALGFCDLLSLYLCSASRDIARLPLAHPANPACAEAVHVTLDPSGETIRFDTPVLQACSKFYVDSWRRSEGGPLISERIDWSFA
jgi:hypothetical protein